MKRSVYSKSFVKVDTSQPQFKKIDEVRYRGGADLRPSVIAGNPYGKEYKNQLPYPRKTF